MTDTECLRWTLLVLVSGGLALLFATTLLRWRQLPRDTRNKGAVLVPIFIGLDGGTWYSISHHFSVNPWLWVTVPAFCLFDAVWGYYLVREARTA